MMEERYYIYFFAVLFIVVLMKLRINKWWKYINFIVFTIYFSLSMIDILTSSSPDGGFIISLLTSFLIIIHLSFIMIMFLLKNRK